jgi:hypothetical protein
VAQVDGSLIARQIAGGGPMVELVTVAATAMAVHPIATFTDNERLRPDAEPCKGQTPYHRTPDRYTGRNLSSVRTCSMLI